MKTLIIAEVGVNHNGDLALAKRLIHEAAQAGADLVKFQTFSANKLVAADAPKAHYQIQTTGSEQSQYEMIRALELSAQDHIALVNTCAHYGIGFFSTAFDHESFDFLAQLDLPYVKVPSGELTNLPLLRHMAKAGKPMIVSTGMATLGEIEEAIGVIEACGTPRERITILHCTTEYPAPMGDVNLRALHTLRSAFGVNVGYSDHTQGIEVPIAAVALGATVIEKHFTLDRSLPGPDHRASLEPDELKAMIHAIRNIELALGDGLKRPTASELKNRPIARKSIVASSPIRKGEVFSAQNLTVKRPGTGISPMQWDAIIGREATKDFQPDELIQL